MNHFEELTVENFQSYQKTTVAFGGTGQLTVLVGATDSGKTAMLRSLLWLLQNAFQGDDFIRVGATFARVTLKMKSGHRVIRERGKSFNRYITVSPEGERQVYEGFGYVVPLEVQQITGVRSVQIGDMELNLNMSEQLDAPFLGKQAISTGNRAVILGKMAGTEEIDQAGKDLGKDLHRGKQDKKRLEEEIEGLTYKIGEYDYLPEMARKIEALEKLLAVVQLAQERREKLAGKLEALRRVKAGIAGTEAVIKRWKCIELVEDAIIRAEKAIGRAEVLRQAERGLERATEGISEAQGTLNRWQYVELAELALASAEKTAVQVGTLRQAARRLMEATRGIQQARETMDKLAGLESAQEAIVRAENAVQRQGSIMKLGISLGGLDEAILGTKATAEQFERILEAQAAFNNAVVAVDRKNAIKKNQSLYRQLETAIYQNKTAAKQLARVEAAEKVLAGAEVAKERQSKVIELAGRIRKIKDEERKAQQAAALWEQRVSELQGAYQDQLVLSGVCPVCGSEIDPEKLKEVI